TFALSGERSGGSSLDHEHLMKKLFRSDDPLVRKPDGFRFVDRIADEALLVQSVHRAPVESLPCSAVPVERQVEQRENRIVDPVLVDLHCAMFSRFQSILIIRYSIPYAARVRRGAFISCTSGSSMVPAPSGQWDFWRRWRSNAAGSTLRSLDLRPRRNRRGTAAVAPTKRS